MHLGHLLVAEMLDALEAEELALAANGAHIVAGSLRGADRRVRPSVIGKDHRRCALRQQRIEQTHLRRHVVFHGRMIVHVVPAQIGKAGGRQHDAIEAALVEAVARGLHRRMRHALVGEFAEQCVQCKRVRRGQRAIVVARRGNDTGRTDLRGGMAGFSPDLAGEGGNRSLAGGTGHRNHCLRLASDKAGSRQRQKTARIVNGNDGNGCIDGMRGDDSEGAFLDSLGDESRSVSLGPGESEEYGTRLDLAAIGREPPYFDGRSATGCHLIPKLFASQCAQKHLQSILPGQVPRIAPPVVVLINKRRATLSRLPRKWVLHQELRRFCG